MIFLPNNKKQCIFKAFGQNPCISKKTRASSRLLTQNRVSEVFWDPIKNRVSPRSVLLKAVYLEALLYHLPL